MSEVLGQTGLFEQQLARKEAVTPTLGEKAVMHVTDLTPVEGADAPPIMFVPSVLGSPKRLEPAMREFWTRGRRLLAVEHPQRHGYKSDTLDGRRYPDVSKLELGRASLLLTALESKDVSQVDIVGQCEGAINASLFASAYPERVRSIVLINPSGIGEDSLARHIKYFVTRTTRSMSRKMSGILSQTAQTTSHPLLHHATNPLFHVRSLHALANSRIDSLFGEIEDAGVRVGVLKGSTDRLYPIERTERYIDTDVLSMYEVMSDPKSGHDPLINLPDATVQAVLRMQQEMCD